MGKMKYINILLFFFLSSTDAFGPTLQHSRRQSTSRNLKVGESAPDFSLTDQNGKTVVRSSIKKPLVVYFYPADSTPGCTVEANAFGEKLQSIRKEFGADVVGISSGNLESKKKFADELDIKFSILSDESDKVRKDFNVPRAAFGLFPGRVTYVLDKAGICQLVYDELGNAASHVDKAVEQLEGMKPKSSNPFASILG